jgi:FKBP-type peptidyl-prolyl cis-trans isomerase
MGSDHCMKIKHSLTICALSVGLAALASAQDIKFNVPSDSNGQPAAPAAAPAAPAAAPKAGFTEAQECEELGWMLGKRLPISQYNFTQEQTDALLKGITEALNGADSPYDIQKAGPAAGAFFEDKRKAMLAKLNQADHAEADAFFVRLKDNKNVTELPSGLRYEILKTGDGPYPSDTDTVTINYTGTLVNGSIFDSSAQHGHAADFSLAPGSVIPGLVEGLGKINKGGKIRLYIPSQLAYGDNPNGPIPPGSALIFEVELVDFKPTTPAAGK